VAAALPRDNRRDLSRERPRVGYRVDSEVGRRRSEVGDGPCTTEVQRAQRADCLADANQVRASLRDALAELVPMAVLRAETHLKRRVPARHSLGEGGAGAEGVREVRITVAGDAEHLYLLVVCEGEGGNGRPDHRQGTASREDQR